MALFDIEKPKILLRDRFGWPPFSILDTEMREWLDGAAEWKPIIGNSCEGRSLINKDQGSLPYHITNGHCKKAEDTSSAAVSEFDPMLAELMIRWFSESGDVVFDPLAGGTTRGVVSAILGRNYLGLDLSRGQVEANQKAYSSLKDKVDFTGTSQWVEFDSVYLFREDFADMVFTCPPYFNLEIYSRDPRDISATDDYNVFIYKYSRVLQNAVKALKNNRFFVVVVSEVRKGRDTPDSEYVGLVPDTVCILRDLGLKYYNEIILKTSKGTLPLRAPRYFADSRKLGRQHQNVLVFYKGDLTTIHDRYRSTP